ncbi:MAG TPA: TetR/AcrR family transcriptional regulator [Ktedonobacteraceae bacterium]|jgi:AcrR family transcriptional regulator|nr:TetR/AcrR family transcriptional regulator [Ktedonobacteraceae bacterium]
MTLSHQENTPKGAGRPRSQQAHQAIIQAALEILAEVGFESMSMEEVAAWAGVGKATIYRRWPSKVELVIDALQHFQEEIPIIDTGHLRDDLIAMIHHFTPEHASLMENIQRRALSEMKNHPEIHAAMHACLVEPRLEAVHQFILRAQARGEIRTDISDRLIVSMVMGPLFYQTYLLKKVSHSTPFQAEEVVDAVLRGLATDRYLQRIRTHENGSSDDHL